MWLVTAQKLKSKNPKWRLAAVEKLVQMEDEKVLVPLMNALKDSEAAIRKTAAKGLGKFKDETSGKALIAALSDSHPDVRTAVAIALKLSLNKAAIPALESALKDTNEGVRAYVALALDALDWSPSTDEQRVLRAVALGKLEEAARFKTLAVEPLLGVLRTGIYYKRLEAVDALSRIADARVVGPLITALKDEDSSVRTRIVEILSKLGDARAVEPLILCLKDESLQVRAAAVEGLSKIGDTRALKPMAVLLKGKSIEVRKAAAEGLGKMKSTGAVDALVDMFRDPDRDIRETTALALGRIGDARAISKLVLCLFDKQDGVRQAAEVALARIDANWKNSVGAQNAIPAVEAAAQDEDYWVRQTATALLKRLVGDAFGPEVEEAVNGEITTITDRPYYKRRDAANILSAALKDVDRNLRLAAANALGQIGNKLVEESLVEALRDQDLWVRRASARALDALQWQPTSDPQRAVHLIALGAWPKVAECGRHAVKPLIEFLQDNDWSVRSAAAEALGQISDTQSEPALAACLHDHHARVRQSAARALQKIGVHNLDDSHTMLLAKELAN